MTTKGREFPQSESRAGGIATRDHQLIQQWAARHQAEPATGAATASGPASVQVNDGGAAVRFNFPGFARFRPISWDEWFATFDRDHLVFVYEQEVADRAYEIWEAKGGDHGHDRTDWFEAEQEMKASAGGPLARYRFVQESDLKS